MSTQGLDPQQTEAVTRIRYIVHECLRDQVGTSMLVSNIPQVEHGKRVRGKEMIRRKSNGKRRRKDDPIPSHAVSEGDQSQLCGAAGEIDYSQLCLTDAEVDDLQLCHAGGDGVGAQLHTTMEVDDSLLCNPTDDIDDAQTCIGVTGVDDSQVCHAVIKGETQIPIPTLKTNEDVEQHNDYTIVV